MYGSGTWNLEYGIASNSYSPSTQNINFASSTPEGTCVQYLVYMIIPGSRVRYVLVQLVFLLAACYHVITRLLRYMHYLHKRKTHGINNPFLTEKKKKKKQRYSRALRVYGLMRRATFSNVPGFGKQGAARQQSRGGI